MNARFCFILIICWLSLSHLQAQTEDSVSGFSYSRWSFDPDRDAQKDIQEAIAQAKKLNKRIYLDVGGEWCIWCHRLDSLFIHHKELREYLQQHYIIVKINVSKENKNEKVLSRYPEITGYPHVFVLNKFGKLIRSQHTEEWEYPKNYPVKGYIPKKVFTFLKKWAK